MADGKVIRDITNSEIWGTTWEWQVDASVEVVWWWSGDFMEDEKWMTSVVKETALVGGYSNVVGCTRRCDCYRAPFVHGNEKEYPPEFVFYGLQQLLSLDNDNHSYSYAAVGGNLPGFDNGFVDYKSYYSVVEGPTKEKSLVRWGYTCKPSEVYTKEESNAICLEVYAPSIADLRKVVPQGIPKSGRKIKRKH